MYLILGRGLYMLYNANYLKSRRDIEILSEIQENPYMFVC